MTDIAQFSGKEFAVILVDYCEKKEGDWILVRGVGKVKEGRLFVDRGTEADFPIPEDTYERIQITPDEWHIRLSGKMRKSLSTNARHTLIETLQ